MILTNINNPSVLIVGLPNLVKSANIWKLKTNYQTHLDSSINSTVEYYSMHEEATSTRYLKKHFEEDVQQIKEYCDLYDVTTVAVTNAKFWKFATKDNNFTANMESGKVLNGVGLLKDIALVPLLNYFVPIMQPHMAKVMTKSLDTLNKVLLGTHKAPESKLKLITTDILHTVDEIREALDTLLFNDVLTFDIEGTGLFLGKDRIITLAIAESTTRGISIPMCPEYSTDYIEIRELVKDFLDNYKGEQVWHNASFDIPFIVRDLYGLEPTENKAINDKINSWNIVDTLLIKYLCVNGLGRQSLGLKEELLPLYGEYDADIDQSNLLAYNYEDVARYNIYDVTGTFEVYEKYMQKLYDEEQDEIYHTYYKPSQKALMKMKCKGFSINIDGVDDAVEELEILLAKHNSILQGSHYVKEAEMDLNYNAMIKYNTTHVKQKSVEDFDIKFNAGSSLQKRLLLIDIMGFKVLETTKTGNPSLGKEIVEQYKHHTNDPEKLEVLDALIEIGNAGKVLSSFLKNFKVGATHCKTDNSYRIHSDYNLHGTVSGRLSSSSPAKINMQNLPSGSVYGSLIKKLFVPPEGFIFAGSDFNALEDRVIAQQSGDAIKQKIILDGYDGHSLYVTIYEPDKLKEMGLPYDTQTLTAEQSYEIKAGAGALRDSRKKVTFALAYQGTEHTVAKALSIPKSEAEVIVNNYHKAHFKITEFQDDVVKQGTAKGYYVTDLGLKIRSKELQSSDEQLQAKAGRSLANAATQGVAGMLTINALTLFQQLIEDSNMDEHVIIVNTIHDAIYMYVRNDVKIIQWVNMNLIKCMTRDYTEEQVIPLAANLDIGYSWKDQLELKNNCSQAEILDTLARKK